MYTCLQKEAEEAYGERPVFISSNCLVSLDEFPTLSELSQRALLRPPTTTIMAPPATAPKPRKSARSRKLSTMAMSQE